MTHDDLIKDIAVGQIPEEKVVTDSGWREVRGVNVRTAVIGGSPNQLRRRWFEAQLIKKESNRTAA